MDNLVLVPIFLIACVGFAVITLGIIADSKANDRRIRLDERQQIINAIMEIKPLASSPDVRDTKNQIIDAITKRNLSDG